MGGADRRRAAREWFSPGLTALWAQCDGRACKIEDELGVGFQRRESRRSREASGMRSAVATLTPDNWIRKPDRESEICYDLVFWSSDVGRPMMSIQ